MAERLTDGNAQAMQQFIGQSPWDSMPVRRRFAERMAKELVPTSAWPIDDTGLLKKEIMLLELPASIQAP